MHGKVSEFYKGFAVHKHVQHLHSKEKDASAQWSKVVGTLINFVVNEIILLNIKLSIHDPTASPKGPKVGAVKSLGEESRNLADPSKKREHRVKRRLCTCSSEGSSKRGKVPSDRCSFVRALLSHSYRHHKRGMGKARQGSREQRGRTRQL